jgi:hypothetical protein
MSRANHPANHPANLLLRDCDIQRTRRSGPGGQHRNKVEKAIVLVHRPTGVRAEAGERRSQAENLSVAVFRLRVNLALAVRKNVNPSYISSDIWNARCQHGRLAINPTHDDFPALLAEALDVLASADYEFPPAAERLGCNPSQLRKLLQREHRAFALVNRERQDRGLPALK